MEQLSLKNLTKSSTTRHIKSSMTNSPKIKRRHSSPALVALVAPATPPAAPPAATPAAPAAAPPAAPPAATPAAPAATPAAPAAPAAASPAAPAAAPPAATKPALSAPPAATSPVAAAVAAPAPAPPSAVVAKPAVTPVAALSPAPAPPAPPPATLPAAPAAPALVAAVTPRLEATFKRGQKHAPSTKILMSEYEIRTYTDTMNRANTIRLNKDDLQTAINFANLFINHARGRIQQLREKLTNPDTLVIIPGNNKNNEHYLGKGLAVQQWGKTDINIYAWKLFIDDLTNELNNLHHEFPYQVIYDTFDRSKADDNNIIVWGANSHNVEGENDHYIDGGGQAAVIETYGDGIFGIITTPLTGPPIDRKRQLEISKEKHFKILKEKQEQKRLKLNVSHKYLTYKNNFNQSKYYEKYLKYKLKYNQLKEKFN